MEFKFNLNDQCYNEMLYLYNDESIVSNGINNFVLYLGDFTFGLSIDRESKRVRNFIGYSSNFMPTNFLKIPQARKGELFINEVPEGDGVYYPNEYGFIAKGFYNIETGWYRVGEDCSTGDTVEIAINTLINLEDGKIKAIYFKPIIAT